MLTLPAYAMVGVMSLVDGLVQRDLRRFGGGLESGLLYHHRKAMRRPMLSLPLFLYLISPWSLHPTTIFVPFVLGFGPFVQGTVARLKKYLWAFWSCFMSEINRANPLPPILAGLLFVVAVLVWMG